MVDAWTQTTPRAERDKRNKEAKLLQKDAQDNLPLEQQ